MSKSVLTSIQPYYVFLIIAKAMGWDISQVKTLEVRKDCPKDKAWNKITHIYCSKNRKSFNRIPKQYQSLMERLLGKVIGEFVCDRIDEFESEFYNDDTVYQDIRYVEPDDDEPPEWWARHIIEANDDYDHEVNQSWLCKESCLTRDEIWKYVGIGFVKTFYGWHVSNLKIYDTPKELEEFKTPPCERPESACDNCKHKVNVGSYYYPEYDCAYENGKTLMRPPQSWCYVEELQNGKI